MAEQHGKALVPQIRFAGFTDPWEQRKLSELVEIERGGSPRPIERYITDDPCGLNWVKIGDAPELGRYITQTAEKIKPEGLAKTRQVYPGDLVLSNSMSFGRPYIMAIKGCIHDGWLLIRDAQKHFDPIFLCHMLGAPQMLNQYRMFAAGSTVNNLNKELVEKAIVSLPSKDEQREIGIVLDRLDSLITLHQRKYDKLCVLKKSMLDKMFPKGGSLYPEIRFAGFTDPWEQRKLGEIATFGGGHTPSMSDSDNYEGGNVLWVTSQDVKSHYLDGTTTQITEKGAKELTLYPAGSLVMVTRSGILRHTLPVAELRKPSTVNQDIRVILPQGKYYGQWLLQFFISRNKELLLEFGKTGTTVESVDFSKMRDMVLLTPSLPEQQQIGHYFARLDNLITLHQRKLELLRNIKKSMLDKMFV